MIEKIATEIGGTVNDAIAVVFGGALRRYLIEIDALPDRPLVAGMFASLCATVDEKTVENAGNVITFNFADLATDIDDVGQRAVRVNCSAQVCKDHLRGLRGNAMTSRVVPRKHTTDDFLRLRLRRPPRSAMGGRRRGLGRRR